MDEAIPDALSLKAVWREAPEFKDRGNPVTFLLPGDLIRLRAEDRIYRAEVFEIGEDGDPILGLLGYNPEDSMPEGVDYELICKNILDPRVIFMPDVAIPIDPTIWDLPEEDT